MDWEQGWKGGLPETPCGAGSKLHNTKHQRLWIGKIISEYQIKSIADIGAGDMNWISHINLEGIKYRAYDIYPRKEIIKKFDLTVSKAPKADLILCIWVLNHLEEDDYSKAVGNLLASKSKYLIVIDRGKHKRPFEKNWDFIETLVLDKNKNDILGLVKLNDN